ncbi:MAG: hypothetical protein HN679_04465 [Candidatus Pacebacteria bacterium]|nr:hypothetical protein [Candidatus Paceibacterota bacterium]MBT4005318.1 hypothetical protein [Candidatus Paceibacterota bacterium]MBT4680822.1 hypothetical protein [Candidatus Paceibacterota bacterium]MBT7499918.1 hypothetical protein [Candidatus Paceibacterota bacterium]
MSMANASQPTTLAERPYTMSEISNSSWPRNLVAVEGAKIENGVMEMKVDQDEFDLESIFVDFGQLADVFEIDESAIIWFAHEAPNPISADTIQIQAPDDEYGTPGTFVSGLTRRQ